MVEAAVSSNSVKEQLYASFDAINNTQEKKNNAWKIRIIKILLVALILVLCAELAFYTIIIPCTAPIQIQFQGMQTVSVDE